MFDSKARITRAAAAKLVGVSYVHVGKLVQEGKLSVGADDKFGLDEFCLGYVNHLKAERRDASLNSSQIRVANARAEKLEADLDIKRRKFIPADLNLRVLSETLHRLKSSLSGVPSQVTRDLAFREKIQEGIDEALNEFCRLVAEQEAECARLAAEDATKDEGKQNGEAQKPTHESGNRKMRRGISKGAARQNGLP